MKKLLVAATFVFASTSVLSASEPANTPPPPRKPSCKAEAKARNLTGDERSAFIQQCKEERRAARQEKMKTCNAEASKKALRGDERRAFMSECLKG